MIRPVKRGLNFLTAMIASGTTNGKAANIATTAIKL
jgi:hypothetical protein